MLVEVQILHRFAVVVSDTVNAAGAFLMHDAPTNISVIPVNYPYSTLGAGIHIETKEMLIIGYYKVSTMCASKAGSFSLKFIHIEQMVVNISHVRLTMIFLRKCAAGINLATSVGKPTFSLAGVLHVHRTIHPEISFSTFVRSTCIILVYVLGDGFDVIINMGIKMLSSLSMKASALHYVPKVWDYAGGNESLSSIIEVYPPWITSTPAKDFEFFLGGMIAPHASVDALTFAIRCSQFADIAMSEHTVASIKPAVRAPGETV